MHRARVYFLGVVFLAMAGAERQSMRAQTLPNLPPRLTITADHTTAVRQGGGFLTGTDNAGYGYHLPLKADATLYNGNVRIRRDDVLVQADAAEYDPNTGDIQMAGDVKMSLQPGAAAN